MALYEVVLRQRYFSQLIVNVFDYLTPSGVGITPNALELLTLMGFIPAGDPLEFPADTIAANLQAVQNASVEFLSVEARELYSVSDFYEAAYSPPLVGTRVSGQASPPFVSYGLYTARVRLDIRRGFKRFVGASEGDVSDGGLIVSGMMTLLTALADSMSENLEGFSAFYHPAVISREKVIDPEDGKVSYQLYADESEQEEHTAEPLVWTPYAEVRSQVSRQYGRGQ